SSSALSSPRCMRMWKGCLWWYFCSRTARRQKMNSSLDQSSGNSSLHFHPVPSYLNSAAGQQTALGGFIIQYRIGIVDMLIDLARQGPSGKVFGASSLATDLQVPHLAGCQPADAQPDHLVLCPERSIDEGAAHTGQLGIQFARPGFDGWRVNSDGAA